MTTPLPDTIPETAQAIVARCDAKEHPDAIAAALDVSTGYVYQVLRLYRPDRARKPRAKKSALRLRILLGKATGKKPGEIAAELAGQCSRAYIYSVWNEGVA